MNSIKHCKQLTRKAIEDNELLHRHEHKLQGNCHEKGTSANFSSYSKRKFDNRTRNPESKKVTEEFHEEHCIYLEIPVKLQLVSRMPPEDGDQYDKKLPKRNIHNYSPGKMTVQI